MLLAVAQRQQHRADFPGTTLYKGVTLQLHRLMIPHLTPTATACAATTRAKFEQQALDVCLDLTSHGLVTQEQKGSTVADLDLEEHRKA
ncbi:hypothetical protein [Rhizobium leguminosarum]|uniref:hypothetical protein n=1 Tax=Rhizobium leguminosarum TaxID=384 RepID=UPI002FF32AD3